MPTGKPPNPLRHVSQLIQLGHQKPSPPPTAEPHRERAGSFVDDEAPTAKNGIEIQAYLLVQFFKRCGEKNRLEALRDLERRAEEDDPKT